METPEDPERVDESGGSTATTSAPTSHRSIFYFRASLFGHFLFLGMSTIACPLAMLFYPDTDVGFCGGSALKWFIALFVLFGSALMAGIVAWYIQVGRPIINEQMCCLQSSTFVPTANLNIIADRQQKTVYLGILVAIMFAISMFGFRAAWPDEGGWARTHQFTGTTECDHIFAASRFACVTYFLLTSLLAAGYVISYNYVLFLRKMPDNLH